MRTLLVLLGLLCLLGMIWQSGPKQLKLMLVILVLVHMQQSLEQRWYNNCSIFLRFSWCAYVVWIIKGSRERCAYCSLSCIVWWQLAPLQISRRVKQVPLAFFKATPSSLFSETDFAGWTFKCEETPKMINDREST